jgi:hypothetical protein
MRLTERLRFTRIHALVFHSQAEVVADPVPYDLRVLDGKEKIHHPAILARKYYKAYAVSDRGKLVHVSLVFRHNLMARQLGFRKVLTIGNCFTDEEYRGQGLYPAVLRRIRADFPDRAFVVFVEPDNVASVRGLERAGFRRLYEFVMYRFFGICLHKRKVTSRMGPEGP